MQPFFQSCISVPASLHSPVYKSQQQHNIYSYHRQDAGWLEFSGVDVSLAGFTGRLAPAALRKFFWFFISRDVVFYLHLMVM